MRSTPFESDPFTKRGQCRRPGSQTTGITPFGAIPLFGAKPPFGAIPPLVLTFTQAHLCDTPFCNVSHDSCAKPKKNKCEGVCEPNATSLARYEKYRCWAFKQIGCLESSKFQELRLFKSTTGRQQAFKPVFSQLGLFLKFRQEKGT